MKARIKKGADLTPDDKDFVLTHIKPAEAPAKEYLLRHRFKTTKFGLLDRRCRAPIAGDAYRAELGQLRALARAIVVEIKREQKKEAE